MGERNIPLWPLAAWLSKDTLEFFLIRREFRLFKIPTLLLVGCLRKVRLEGEEELADKSVP
jgi:hypothetical protein